MRKMYKCILYITFITLIIFISYDEVNANIYVPQVSIYQHNTGSAVIEWEFSGQYDYFIIYESTDSVNFDRLGTTTNQRFVRNGLTNGTTYYYRIEVVVNGIVYGPSLASRYTPPYTVKIVDEPLIVVDYETDSVQLDWRSLDSGRTGADLYMNGEFLYEIPPNVTSDTVTNLQPGTIYEFYIITKKGIMSNKVRVRTRSYDDFFSRFNDSMRNLFVPNDDIDRNGNSIPDWYEPILDLEGELKDWGPIKFLDDIKDIFDRANRDYVGRGDDLIEGKHPGPGIPDGSGIPIVMDPSTGESIIEIPSFLDAYEQFPSWLKEMFEYIRDILSYILWISFFIYIFARWMPRATL